MTRTFLLATILFFSIIVAHAQEKTAVDTTGGAPQQQVEMAEVMRSEGKIYVVVGIVMIVLAIMLIYLFTIDRNVKRLEKQLAEKGK
jgi:Na+/alanine symporter